MWLTRFKSSRAHHENQIAFREESPKPLFAAVFLSGELLAGCASHQCVVALDNGHRVIATEKPHLEGFNFAFTGLDGRTNSIPSLQVRAIVPASSQPPAR
jgi:hypothetical protein